MAIVYITKNLIDGKKYIGVDGKNDPTYLGSGKHLKIAIGKYGKDNFLKEILFKFPDEESAYLKEKEIILELDAVKSPDYYNIHPGGMGGWGHVDVIGENNPMYGKSVKDSYIKKYGEELGNELYVESRRKAGEKTSAVLKGRSKSEEHRNNLSESKKNFWKSLSEEEKVERRKKMSLDMKSAGITRSEEYKKKMSESLKRSSDKIHRKEKCNICGKEMSIQNLKRWHGDNCKNKEINK